VQARRGGGAGEAEDKGNHQGGLRCAALCRWLWLCCAVPVVVLMVVAVLCGWLWLVERGSGLHLCIHLHPCLQEPSAASHPQAVTPPNPSPHPHPPHRSVSSCCRASTSCASPRPTSPSSSRTCCSSTSTLCGSSGSTGTTCIRRWVGVWGAWVCVGG